MPKLLAALLLTLALEGAYFAARRYKSKDFWTAFLLVNVITNLSLNVILGFVFEALLDKLWLYYLFLAAAELCVVIAEFFGISLLVSKSKKLFADCAVANAISCVIGTALLLVF